jgi:Flp pilus assembly pilin Flp
MIVLAQRANATSFEIGVILGLMSIGGIPGPLSRIASRECSPSVTSPSVSSDLHALYPLLIVVPSPFLWGHRWPGGRSASLCCRSCKVPIASYWSLTQYRPGRQYCPTPASGRPNRSVLPSLGSCSNLGGQGSIVVGFVAPVLVGAITTLTTDIRNAPYLAEVPPA